MYEVSVNTKNWIKEWTLNNN